MPVSPLQKHRWCAARFYKACYYHCMCKLQVHVASTQWSV
ncbi:hypothetical protein RSAG8_10700, partial [Rhizoctonia solani AG-8 WAC10335]